MNRLKRSSMISIRSGFLAGFFTLILTVGVISGCVTQQQVKDIVNDSNASLVTTMMTDGAGLDVMPVPGSEPGSKQEPWVVPSAKIDTFIETHPDQKVTASALRIRQAMLLLGHEQYNLAQAAFNMVDPQYLTNARDKALYELRTHLVWWFRVSRLPVLPGKEFQKADRALESFQAKVNTLGDSPDIRDYLAEMRVWIALYAARSMTNQAKAKAYLENGIDNYAKIFTDKDLTVLKMTSDPAGWDVSMTVTRRRLRANAVIEYAKKVIKRQRIVPAFQSGVFNQLINVNP